MSRPLITTQQMRKSVTGWLSEENATVTQALQLQAAIEAGAIDGLNYQGHRVDAGPDDYYAAVSAFQDEHAPAASFDTSCGCLLDTIERIRGERPTGTIGTASSQAFALAMMLRLGDTPANSAWARAAVKGIEDYITVKESN